MMSMQILSLRIETDIVYWKIFTRSEFSH